MVRFRPLIQLLVLVLAIVGAATALGAGSDTAGPESTDGDASAPSAVYTASQAASGMQHVQTHCSACHGDDLRGGIQGGPPLTGTYFMNRWSGKTLEDLYTVMFSTMPLNAPSSLPTTTYVEIIAYVLQQNGYPAGDEPIARAVLGEIVIEPQQPQ